MVTQRCFAVCRAHAVGAVLRAKVVCQCLSPVRAQLCPLCVNLRPVSSVSKLVLVWCNFMSNIFDFMSTIHNIMSSMRNFMSGDLHFISGRTNFMSGNLHFISGRPNFMSGDLHFISGRPNFMSCHVYV